MDNFDFNSTRLIISKIMFVPDGFIFVRIAHKYDFCINYSIAGTKIHT